jgi:hypothetical protein
VAACLVLAAGAAVWLVAGRDRHTAGTSASSASSSAPSTVSVLDAPVAGAPTVEALITPADVAGARVTVDAPATIDAPAFPLLCGAADRSDQWSGPRQGLGQEYAGPGAVVSEYAFGYADGAGASAALTRLTSDAASCPSLSTGGSVESAGPAVVGGDESEVFVVDDGGHNGVIGVTWSVVVRSGDTLLQVGYTTRQQIGTSGPVGGGAGPDGRATAEALARAAVDRFATHG